MVLEPFLIMSREQAMDDNELTSASRIFVAGHRGMVGSAIVRQLKLSGYDNVLTRTHAELDLTSQAAVRHFFETEKIDCVVLAAAKVGGIHANNEYPAEFIYQNLMIEANVIHEAYSAGIQRLLFLGSSCIYPKFAEQPMAEAALLTGQLESTNEPYAIAKIAGIKMCESYNRQYGTDYRSIMPTNLYGSAKQPCNSSFDATLSRCQTGRKTRGNYMGYRYTKTGVPACR
jgi:GDP-L-fucose synthase